MKNKKVLLIAHFSVQNFKVSVESWKLYIVLVLGSASVFAGTRNPVFEYPIRDLEGCGGGVLIEKQNIYGSFQQHAHKTCVYLFSVGIYLDVLKKK